MNRISSNSLSLKEGSQFSLKEKSIIKNQNDNVKVVIRCRPPLDREVQDGRFISTVQVSPDHKKICIFEYIDIDSVPTEQLQEYFENQNNYSMSQFTFDYVYDQNNTQEEVYDNTAKAAVLSTLEGYNSTLIAYGQTGTGKTFTMEGFTYNNNDPQRGIIPRSIDEIFKYIQLESDQNTTFMVRASYLQIYNEQISDLLRTERQSLQIREDKKRGVFVEGLSEWAVRSPMEIYSLMKKGANSRATASTKMNDMSSRSHAVFIITVEQMQFQQDVTNSQNSTPKKMKVGKLNLVDLAGSERARVTGATGKRLEECKKINQSLSALGNVISALTESNKPRAHIPYRDSKITRLLEDSLGGNCKTTIMAMISPANESFGESISTLKFANRAKNIKNKAIINEDLDQRALLRKYEEELKRLRQELDEKNNVIGDKAKYFQLEKERQKAEEDRNKVLAAYEERSREFFLERDEKKKLEEKIKQLNSQLLVGGRKIEDTPQFRSALEEQQKVIRSQYESKMTEIEKERKFIEENKAQVDRYKQLLIKQRDIMIALTNRLNERDETILQLQDELDAYDRIHKESENLNENNNYKVKQLENYIKQNGLQLPEIKQIKQEEEQNNQENQTDQLVLQENSGSAIEDNVMPYNVTENNLDMELKVQELSKLNEQKQDKIQNLQQEITHIKQKFNNDNNKLMDDFEKEFEERVSNIQIKYEEEIAILTENAKKYETSQAQFLDLISLKDIEIQKLQNIARNANSNQHRLNTLYGNNQEIKNAVDKIIQTLSQPNDPHKLQNAASDLLKLQLMVSEVLNYIITSQEDTSQKQNGNSFIQQQLQQQQNQQHSMNNSQYSNQNSIYSYKQQQQIQNNSNNNNYYNQQNGNNQQYSQIQNYSQQSQSNYSDSPDLNQKRDRQQQNQIQYSNQQKSSSSQQSNNSVSQQSSQQ